MSRDFAGAFARSAQSLVGTPFRLHGRDPQGGVDCVGLAYCALAGAGRACVPPEGYELRNLDFSRFLPALETTGFAECDGLIEAGDILLAAPSVAQYHLLVVGLDRHFIHAHAGLGRVVATPPPLTWPILRHWRCGRN